MTKKSRRYGRTPKSRFGIKHYRLFARDYEKYEGRWGDWDDPYSGKREQGRNQFIRCFYCGEYVRVDEAAIAHIVALHDGGEDDIDNMVMAHVECNDGENLERSKKQK